MEFLSFFVSKQMPSICILLAEKFEDLTVMLSEQASLQFSLWSFHPFSIILIYLI